MTNEQEQLVAVIEAIDKFIVNICLDNNIPSLSASACILARLSLLNNAMGDGAEYIKLLKTVANTDFESYDKRELH